MCHQTYCTLVDALHQVANDTLHGANIDTIALLGTDVSFGFLRPERLSQRRFSLSVL